MISYDYKIERLDKNKRTDVFVPGKLPRKIDNITYIEGPNSSGKSTLLNLLALAFFGHRNEEIVEALRKKMIHLLNFQRNRVTFRIEIADKNNNPILLAEKKDSKKNEIDIFEYVKGKKERLSLESFEKKYNLIYDIPQNPTDRIRLLTQEIKEIQRRYGDIVSDLKDYIRSILREIESSRDPSKIKKLKQSLKNHEKNCSDLQEELKQNKEILDKIERATYCKYYFKYKEENSKNYNKLISMQSRLKLEKTKKIRGSRDFAQFNRGLLKEITHLKELQENILSSFYSLPKKELEILAVFQKINLDEVVEFLDFPKNLNQIITKMENKCTEMIEDAEKKDYFQKAMFYKELITVLEKHNFLKIDIPGTTKSIKDLINDLKKELRENEHLLKYVENTRKLIEFIKSFSQVKQSIELHYLSDLKELRKENKENSKEVITNQKISLLQEKHKETKAKKDFYYERYMKKSSPDPKKILKLGKGILKKYLNFSEDELLSEISKINSDISRINEEISTYQLKKDLVTNELKALEDQKPHKYTKHQEKLNKLFDITEELTSKLKNDFNKNIEYLEGHSINRGEIDENQKKYNWAVFKYLGKRIEFYRHIKDYYEVEYIDLIEEVLVTKDKKKIYFSEMGTGQSQSAYLLGKLNTSDNRLIIALFDEVAMMDDKSLKPLFDKCRDLYNSGKLLVGIIVQKANEIKIESKIRD